MWFREKFANWGGGLPISVQQVAVGKNVAGADLAPTRVKHTETHPHAANTHTHSHATHCLIHIRRAYLV